MFSTEHTPRLLVVDDEDAFRSLVAGVLSDEGLDVAEASTGEEAVTAFRERSFDLVLLDMHMPGIDGMEVLKLLRAESPLTDCIIVTGYQDLQIAIEALKLGAREFITKPLNPFELVHRVQAMLRLHASDLQLKKLQTEFTSKLLYDLLAPLHSIKSALALLERGTAGPLTEHQGTIVRNTAETVRKLDALLNDMIDLGHFESGRVTLARIPTNLDELIPAICARFKPTAAAQQLDLKVAVNGTIPTVEADPARIEQVMQNLLENALAHSRAGGTITVQVSQVEKPENSKSGEFVEISVTDTGSGISPAQLPHIFDKYEETIASGSTQPRTTGLGLVICRSIIEAHRGSMSAESTLGKGSIFRFLLPVSTS